MKLQPPTKMNVGTTRKENAFLGSGITRFLILLCFGVYSAPAANKAVSHWMLAPVQITQRHYQQTAHGITQANSPTKEGRCEISNTGGEHLSSAALQNLSVESTMQAKRHLVRFLLWQQVLLVWHSIRRTSDILKDRVYLHISTSCVALSAIFSRPYIRIFYL